MCFTAEEIAEMAIADAEIEAEDYVILTPLERIAARQIDREARWEQMDYRAARESQRHFRYRVEHESELRQKRAERHERDREIENECCRQWYQQKRLDKEWMEQKRKMNRAYWKQNAEKYRAQKRKHYAENAERERERKRLYTAAHRDEINARKRAAYAKKKEAEQA